MNNSEDTVLAVVGPRRSPIVVRLNEFNGRKTVDFRRYFYLQEKEDLLPTQKGVSLDRDGFALVQAALSDNVERIADWLNSSSGRTLATNARAVERLQSELRPHRADDEQWKSPTFFHVGAEGSIDHLTYNSAHAFSIAMHALTGYMEDELATLVGQLIAGILISYYRSKMLFDGVAEMSPKDIFDTLEMNWGIILRRYAEQVSAEIGGE